MLVGRVLTCVGDEIIENGFVEIEGKAIKRVGRASDLGATAARVIETGGTILPGLIQSHGHLAWDGIHDLAAQSMDDGPEIAAYKCASNMLVNLKAGVTTFRDLGINRTNLFAKQAVAQGIFPGPRLLVCGQAIVQTGGHTYWCCREASGPDEMRRAVREQVRGGADLIKIMACHDTLEFTDEELEAVIDESHRNKLPITAHADVRRLHQSCCPIWHRRGRAWRLHERGDDRSARGKEGADRDDVRACGGPEPAGNRPEVQHPGMEDRGTAEGGRRSQAL